MIVKIVPVLCVMVYTIRALPQYAKMPSSTDNSDASITSLDRKLEMLGLTLTDSFDYNQYILNLEAIIEESQQIALYAIQSAVELASQVITGLATMAAQQNILSINNIQSNFVKYFEEDRHKAYEKNIDISHCVYVGIKTIHNESISAIADITAKLENITLIFNNYTSNTYVKPAEENLAKTYTIRERIYQCPFDFDDFTLFYICLTIRTVLADIVTINDFAIHYNDTSTKVHNLVVQISATVALYQEENVNVFNSTALSIYNDNFLQCAADKGYII